MRRYIRWILISLVLLILVSGAAVVFATRPAEPMPQALAALQSDAQVQVRTEPWLTFQPQAAEPTTGLIFYPGGLVDARAYAPLARAIAAKGFVVVVVPMPLNLAFFGADRAQEVVRAYPTIKRWAIGGHSLGGVAAAMFVKNHPDAIQGLAFWASYPADDLSNRNIAVLSLYGTQDKLSTPAKVLASKNLLPESTRWVAIEGGNHGQFGWYGLQSGDGGATISRESQQEQIVNETVGFLRQIGN